MVSNPFAKEAAGVMKATALFAIFSLFVIGCAARGDIVSLDRSVTSLYQRVSMLERENAQLKKRLVSLQNEEGQAESLRSKTAQMQASLDQITEEVQTLRGKIEEMEFQKHPRGKGGPEGETRLDALEKGLAEQERRIRRLEGYLNLESGGGKASGTPSGPVSKDEPQKRALSENEAYAKAKQDFDRGAYEQARAEFQAFIKKYPASIHADNAQFWIGESYFREKWYEKAILEYQKVIENYPTGNKVQAALLKQGIAFQKLGDTANARLILKELVRKYPKSTEAKIARRKLKGIP